MNVLFFLTPKKDVTFIYDDFTVRQALEKMKHYRYSAVPMIDQEGKYIGTVTEGDFLWLLIEHQSNNIKDTEHLLVKEMEKHLHYKPVSVDAKIEDLVFSAMSQNFVPVTDDNGTFIGIVTRKDILQYCRSQLFEKNKK